MRRPRPEIEARRSGLCQTPGESVQLLQFYKKKHVLNFHPVSTDLITGELWNHGNGRALAFPLLPGFQRKLVLLKLVAPDTLYCCNAGSVKILFSCVLPVAVDLLVVGSFVGSRTPEKDKMSMKVFCDKSIFTCESQRRYGSC